MKTAQLLLLALVIVVSISCNFSSAPPLLFTEINAKNVGITFVNKIEENAQLNITTYEYMYNGGGVAVGDINNDGLVDIFFTGNQLPGKLYLNNGHFNFEDITQIAGIESHKGWQTGVSMADVNGDGKLDIYICYSGPGTDSSRRNELFINETKNGTVHFTEKAADFGLDALGTFSTQCTFFDMDQDGDLDAFLVNHADMFYNVFFNTRHLRALRHPQFGNRLYRNDAGKFTDISESAGIAGSGINFGLSAAIGDVNEDGWPDIFVTNDYNEQDFLYLNQKNGTFKENLQQCMGHTSLNSMGSDMADVNNDGRYDLIVLDMLPESHERQKFLKGPEGFDVYNRLVDSGFHKQQMRNVLQINMGLAPDSLPRFSEIGQMAGISNTDWSWAPLIADLDNDGWKDLYITNGYVRNFTSLDFLKYTYTQAQQKAQQNGDALLAWQVVKSLQGSPLVNYAFRKKTEGIGFENATANWGLNKATISTGAAIIDLDNDGDLDIITNNINQAPSIWKNNTTQISDNKSVQIQLIGSKANTTAIGTRVVLHGSNGIMQDQTLYPVRGFQSSGQNCLHFGLKKGVLPVKAEVYWPDGTFQTVDSLPNFGRITINQLPTKQPLISTNPTKTLFQCIKSSDLGINYQHISGQFIDFKQQLLLPHQISKQGSFMAVADVNGDGTEDLMVGGTVAEAAKLYLQKEDRKFEKAPNQPWPLGSVSDGGLHFFDADSDGDLDLYMAKMDMVLPEKDPAYQHKLYINDGKGKFNLAPDALPNMAINSIAICSADYNKDGKMDVFVAGRSVPGRFPVTPVSYLLRNISTTNKVQFAYGSEQLSAEMRLPGMVTAATWTDINKDTWPDLILAGEWMPIMIFENQKGQLVAKGNKKGLPLSGGWWSSVLADDLDGDGDTDLFTGNAGTNQQLKANANQPAFLHFNDFDKNGTIDPFVTYTIGKHHTVAVSLDEAAEQVPMLRKKYLRYEAFSKANWQDLFSKAINASTETLTINTLESCWWQNDGSGNFERKTLPEEVQWSMITGASFFDVDGDGFKDLLVTGNYYPMRVQWGPLDASYGWVLKGNGKGQFSTIYPNQSGLWAQGDSRQMLPIILKGNKAWVMSRHNETLLFATLKKP